MRLRAYAHGAHDGSFRACGSAGRARHMGSVCVRSREMQMGVCLTLVSRSGCLERERRARRRAGYQQSVSQICTPRLAHHDSRINHDSTHRESAVRCDGPSRHRQCGHSASCDDYRRTSTTRRSLQHRAARHHTLHRQDSLGRTHAPVQRNRRYREARPKPRTMCCGRCHATRAAGPGAGRDD